MYSLVIVDDETELLEGLSQYFPWGKLGFAVEGAFTNARTALQWCKDNATDVVLTDIRMPFMSGLDLIEQLKDLQHPPLFCIMSAYNDFEYAKQAIRYGVMEYLVKPASFEEIEQTFSNIRTQLDGKVLYSATTPVAEQSLNPLITQALSIIEKRTSTCSLQSIAEELGINPSYLSRLFKEEKGLNFQDYLLQRKMEIAKTMLGGAFGYKNKEIAKALGYQDTQNFCRTFRKYYGTSPQQMRAELTKR